MLATQQMREFSERVQPEAERIAAEQHDYVLMALNGLHEELEERKLTIVFIPMIFGVYQLEFSVFLDPCQIDFDRFASDEYTPHRKGELHLPSGELCIAELGRPFSEPLTVATVPRGSYRVACLGSTEQQGKHELLEGDYPAGDGPDFKFYLGKHPE